MIALCWSDKCEKELIEKGFEKQEVYIKSAPFHSNSEKAEALGDREFFAMDYKPYQFVTTSWWGASND